MQKLTNTNIIFLYFIEFNGKQKYYVERVLRTPFPNYFCSFRLQNIDTLKNNPNPILNYFSIIPNYC